MNTGMEGRGGLVHQQKIGAGTPVKGNDTYHIVLAESDARRRTALP